MVDFLDPGKKLFSNIFSGVDSNRRLICQNLSQQFQEAKLKLPLHFFDVTANFRHVEQLMQKAVDWLPGLKWLQVDNKVSLLNAVASLCMQSLGRFDARRELLPRSLPLRQLEKKPSAEQLFGGNFNAAIDMAFKMSDAKRGETEVMIEEAFEQAIKQLIENESFEEIADHMAQIRDLNWRSRLAVRAIDALLIGQLPWHAIEMAQQMEEELKDLLLLHMVQKTPFIEGQEDFLEEIILLIQDKAKSKEARRVLLEYQILAVDDGIKHLQLEEERAGTDDRAGFTSHLKNSLSLNWLDLSG
ncbi:MAG: hypothetical protein K0S07_620 [Chlamydiales bacterium]|jgi:hypothetical protein|nr:hypothetical protein [Chlamydiales bacterium]